VTISYLYHTIQMEIRRTVDALTEGVGKIKKEGIETLRSLTMTGKGRGIWDSMASGYLLWVSPCDSITGNFDNLDNREDNGRAKEPVTQHLTRAGSVHYLRSVYAKVTVVIELTVTNTYEVLHPCSVVVSSFATNSFPGHAARFCCHDRGSFFRECTKVFGVEIR
jgi:hypothetical protein